MSGVQPAPIGDEDFPIEDESPEPPEIYSLILEERLLGRSFFSGTIRQLPCLYRRELVACLEAEQEFKALQMINAQLKRGYNPNGPD